ncbi:MAG: hypothetical protein PVI86_05690 [Phycisphaerae bacterium]|jgi:hypothetical protein
MNGITDRAGRILASMLEQLRVPPEKAVRYLANGGNGKLAIDVQDPADLAFEHGGRTVLVVDPDSARGVADRQLDYQDESGFCLVSAKR